jgi:hypothetical protein
VFLSTSDLNSLLTLNIEDLNTYYDCDSSASIDNIRPAKLVLGQLGIVVEAEPVNHNTALCSLTESHEWADEYI